MKLNNLIFLLIILFITSCTPSRYLAPVVKNNQSYDSISSVSKRITIYEGDSLYSISKREGVSIRSIIKANNLKPPFILYEGDKIIIPANKIYIVKGGDTLWDIAECYGVTVITIKKINNLKSNAINLGMKLVVPGYNKEDNLACEHEVKTIVKNVKKENNKISQTDSNKSNSTYQWPATGKILSKFGLLAKGLRNDGINILAENGNPVFAVKSGKVVYTGNEIQAFGNLILIKHGNNKTTAYAHLENVKVVKGEVVKKGQIIASVGSSGKVSTPQLHFEIRDTSGPLDPLKYLP